MIGATQITRSSVKYKLALERSPKNIFGQGVAMRLMTRELRWPPHHIRDYHKRQHIR